MDYGLSHDHRRDDVDIMGNGFRNLRWNFSTQTNIRRRIRFSDDNARILYSSPFLAPDSVLSDRIAPTVEMKWASPLRSGATKVQVTVSVSDNEGLRAIQFFSPAQDSVVGGRSLRGKRQNLTCTLKVDPLKSGQFRLRAIVTDVGGNMTTFDLDGTVLML